MLNKLLYRRRFIDIHVVEHCNLNCKCCAHYSPIAKKEYIDTDKLEEMYLSLKPYFSKYFNSIHLLGGEPLLHPNIIDIIKLTREYFPKTEIQIITNGIKLLLLDDDFFDICSKYKIKFYISKYPIKVDYNKIEKKLSKFKIKYYITDEIKNFVNYSLDLSGKQDCNYSYNKCKYAGKCIQLKDNKIYPCFQIAYIEHFNHYFNENLMVNEGDYLDIRKPIKMDEFIKFIHSSKPFCKYCNIKNIKNVNWKRSKKSKREWV